MEQGRQIQASTATATNLTTYQRMCSACLADMRDDLLGVEAQAVVVIGDIRDVGNQLVHARVHDGL